MLPWMRRILPIFLGLRMNDHFGPMAINFSGPVWWTSIYIKLMILSSVEIPKGTGRTFMSSQSFRRVYSWVFYLQSNIRVSDVPDSHFSFNSGQGQASSRQQIPGDSTSRSHSEFKIIAPFLGASKGFFHFNQTCHLGFKWLPTRRSEIVQMIRFSRCVTIRYSNTSKRWNEALPPEKTFWVNGCCCWHSCMMLISWWHWLWWCGRRWWCCCCWWCCWHWNVMFSAVAHGSAWICWKLFLEQSWHHVKKGITTWWLLLGHEQM